MIPPKLASALRRTGRISAERPRATLWTIAAVTCALIALGLAGLVADHVARWTDRPEGSASMVVYLGEGVDEPRARQLAADLARMPGVEHVELVPAAESASRLEHALGADSQLLAGVDVAGLPPSVEVTLAAGMKDVIAMSPTVRALRGAAGVDDVVIEDGGAEHVAGTLRVVRLVACTGAAVLAMLSIIVVLAIVRVRLERSRREHAVLHLLGATSGFVAIPTALAGALQGALAALLATAALYAAVAMYGASIAGALGDALGPVTVAFPGLAEVALFVAIGALLGLIGGALAGWSRASR